MRLPLFPLHTVLLPETTLPLHVFEPRYRELVGRCLEHDESFGIVLIREGEEVGAPAIPYAIGTEARIIACRRHADGRYDVVVEGGRRFEIESLDRNRPLLRAEVRPLPEDPGTDASLAATVSALCDELMDSLDLEGAVGIEGMSDARSLLALSYRVASLLPVLPEERQRLLEQPSTDDRLRSEADILMRIAQRGARIRLT